MIEGVRLKNLFLRLLPYLISLAAGYMLYLLSIKYVEDNDLSGLLSNIAAGLLSIPLIFISYELVNDICTRNIKNSMLKSLIFEINYSIIDIIKTTRKMLGMNEQIDEESLEALLDKNKSFIKSHLAVKPEFGQMLQEDNAKLFKLTHNNPNLGVLSDAQIKALMMISKNIVIIYKEIENKSTHKEVVEENVYQLLQALSKWVDLGEEDAIVNHHNFSLQ